MFTYFKRKKFINQVSFITGYTFPVEMYDKIKAQKSDLTDEQIDFIYKGLKTYFIMHLMPHEHPLAMPSKMVDIAWHEFILFTKDYRFFCEKAFGKYFDHTPNKKDAELDINCVVIKRDMDMAKKAHTRLKLIISGIDPGREKYLSNLYLDKFINLISFQGKLIDIFNVDSLIASNVYVGAVTKQSSVESLNSKVDARIANKPSIPKSMENKSSRSVSSNQSNHTQTPIFADTQSSGKQGSCPTDSQQSSACHTSSSNANSHSSHSSSSHSSHSCSSSSCSSCSSCSSS